MGHLDGILKLVDAEFDAIEKNGKFRSREEIDNVYKLVDIVKDIHCIWSYEEDEYSEMGGRSYRGRSYDGDMSEARGRGRGANRYADGRYAPASRAGDPAGVVSRDGGKEEYLDNLRMMADAAPDDRTRNNILRMIREIERG